MPECRLALSSLNEPSHWAYPPQTVNAPLTALNFNAAIPECQRRHLGSQVEVAEGGVCTQAEVSGIRSASVETDRRAAKSRNGKAVTIKQRKRKQQNGTARFRASRCRLKATDTSLSTANTAFPEQACADTFKRLPRRIRALQVEVNFLQDKLFLQQVRRTVLFSTIMRLTEAWRFWLSIRSWMFQTPFPSRVRASSALKTTHFPISI